MAEVTGADDVDAFAFGPQCNVRKLQRAARGA